MKTISTYKLTNNHNATKSQLEHERDACEEELYRLRFGIENLLNNQKDDNLKFQYQRKFPNPFRTMTNNIGESNNRKNTNWLDQCCPPCCRRWRRNRPENNRNQIYNDRNYATSPQQAQLYSDSLVSTSPSLSVSSYYTDTNSSYENNDLKHNVENLVNQSNPDISNLLQSKDINDPSYNALIVKILEAKALDCLCAGYSKQNTQKQIQNAVADLTQRVDQPPWDADSISPSPSPSSSSILSDIQTPDEHKLTSTLVSPANNIHSIKNEKRFPVKEKSTSKLNDDIKLPKKNSTIAEAKTTKPSNV